jgi:putative ubiquitin-RnfH superfamily antitoxin RatB of RatAB toxin-antitoxin module
MTERREIGVEVAYAEPDNQVIVSLRLPAGASAGDAVQRSGLLERFPGITWPGAPIGIFGKPVSPSASLTEGDRVEIYRPLRMNPKEARRLRAARSRSRRGS